MKDGSQLSDDPYFWKALHEFLFEAWRQIEPRPADQPSLRDSVNPVYGWIRDRISSTVNPVNPPDASKDALHQRQTSELPAATTLPQTRATKKRSRDFSADGADESEAIPLKRPKRNSTSHAGLEGQATPSKRIVQTQKASVTVSRNLPRIECSRNKARLEMSHAARQPLRRSPRIAALHAAKVKDEQADLVSHPTTNIATAAVGS